MALVDLVKSLAVLEEQTNLCYLHRGKIEFVKQFMLVQFVECWIDSLKFAVSLVELKHHLDRVNAL